MTCWRANECCKGMPMRVSAQLPTVPSLAAPPAASTTAARAHLRAVRDTGNTCHGSPDLGEGSSRDHTCTTCPRNAKRRRQDYRCTCMCGDSRGSHVQWRQTGHQSDTQGACRAVNQWTTTGNWHNTIYIHCNRTTGQ